MTGDAHWGFIVAAYGFGVLVVGGMTVAIIWDGRRLRRALARFDGRDGRS